MTSALRSAGSALTAAIVMASASIAQAAPTLTSTFEGDGKAEQGAVAKTLVRSHADAIKAQEEFIAGLKTDGSTLTESFSDTKGVDDQPTGTNRVFGNLFAGRGSLTSLGVNDSLNPGSANMAVDPFAGGTWSGRYGMTVPTTDYNGLLTDYYFQTDTSFRIDLTETRNAFGLYLIDLGDFAASVDLYLGNTKVKTIDPSGGQTPLPDSGGLIFFGAYSDQAFDSIEFRIVQGCQSGQTECPDILGIDEVIFGNVAPPTDNPTPTPATLPLVALALLGAAALRRRRA